MLRDHDEIEFLVELRYGGVNGIPVVGVLEVQPEVEELLVVDDVQERMIFNQLDILFGIFHELLNDIRVLPAHAFELPPETGVHVEEDEGRDELRCGIAQDCHIFGIVDHGLHLGPVVAGVTGEDVESHVAFPVVSFLARLRDHVAVEWLGAVHVGLAVRWDGDREVVPVRIEVEDTGRRAARSLVGLDEHDVVLWGT